MICVRRCLFVLFITTSALAIGVGQKSVDTSQARIGNPVLRKTLLALEVADQGVRNEFIKFFSARPIDSVAFLRAIKTMDSIDRNDTRVLKEILLNNPWPGKGMVGPDGAGAAFLLLQHSPDTAFQRSCLVLLQNAFKAGEASADQLALLTDRVLVREGKPQLYGTQTCIIGYRVLVDSIEDSANVDNRRAKLGLQPLSEYLKQLKEFYHIKDGK
jgi:hypothetical protein